VILRVADLWFRGLWWLEVRTGRVPKGCRVPYVRTVKTSGATQAMPLRRNRVADVWGAGV